MYIFIYIDTPILLQLGIWFSNIFNDWEGNYCSWSNFFSLLVFPVPFAVCRFPAFILRETKTYRCKMGPVDLAHPCCGTEGFILPYTFFILPVLPKNTGRNWGVCRCLRCLINRGKSIHWHTLAASEAASGISPCHRCHRKCRGRATQQLFKSLRQNFRWMNSLWIGQIDIKLVRVGTVSHLSRLGWSRVVSCLAKCMKRGTSIFNTLTVDRTRVPTCVQPRSFSHISYSRNARHA